MLKKRNLLFLSLLILVVLLVTSCLPKPPVLVTFDSQGGSAVNAQTVDQGELVTEPTAPTKTGSTFGGWYKEPGCTNPWDFDSDTVTADVTLYAKWTTDTYTVTFKKNAAGVTGTMTAQTIASGSSAKLKACAFSKTGWTFAGWATTSGGTVKYNDEANYTMGTANVTLYAKWRDPVHNITKGTYYTTIQAALDVADSVDGDTIEVADGTYNESIIFPDGKVITLRSINGASFTTITGVDDSATVTCSNSPNGTTLEGFMITHNSGESGSGISANVGCYLIINNCTISNNSATTGGGIMNRATLTITGSTVSDNSDTYAGGGIYNGGILTITGSTVFDNSATSHGGGIENRSLLTITGSTISNNSATTGGGIVNVGILTITGSTISNNSAADGGGIFNSGTLIIKEGSIISDNSATAFGGGIVNDYDALNIPGKLDITGSTISNNSAADGGGIYLQVEGIIIIGGSSDTDTDNFNNLINNYKQGSAPSADQHIRNESGDCHEVYSFNNFDPN